MWTLLIASTWDGQPIAAAEQATVRLTAQEGGLVVEIDAPFHGDPPPPGAPGPTWKLWEHEVVELFVLGADDHYTELEISPHGHYLLLRLEGRRNVVARELPLAVTVSRTDGRWQAKTVLPASVLPIGPWRANAYAIHGLGEARRYLAWTPAPGPAPDFHRIEVFPLLP